MVKESSDEILIKASMKAAKEEVERYDNLPFYKKIKERYGEEIKRILFISILRMIQVTCFMIAIYYFMKLI